MYLLYFDSFLIGFLRKSAMANKDNNMNLQIHSNVLELKNLVQTIVEEINNLKKFKEMISVKDDLKAFEAMIKELEKKQEEFEGKIKLLLHWLKEKALQELNKWEELERNFGESKKEEALEEVLLQKIKETRMKWIREAEKKQNDLKGWLQKQGNELSGLLIRFLRFVLLDMEEEDKSELMIKRVRSSLLELRSIGEKYSPVIDSFISVVKLGVENVELPRSKKMKILCDKRKTDEVLGLILEEVLCLEIVFNYPSLYPEMSTTGSLDQISEKINGIYSNFLFLRGVDVISQEIAEKLSLEFEKRWEELDIPRTGLMVREGHKNINLRICRNFLELKNLIRSMEEETDNVKMLKRGIIVEDDIKLLQLKN